VAISALSKELAHFQGENLEDAPSSEQPCDYRAVADQCQVLTIREMSCAISFSPLRLEIQERALSPYPFFTSLFRKVGFVLWAAIAAYAISLLLQGVWTTLLVQNLRFYPTVPWSIVPMLFVLWLAWLWLSGRGWPRSTAQSRRELLRARQAKGVEFLLAFIAGGLGVIALCGLWIVLAESIEVPASALPDMSKYPAAVVYSLIGMGALVGAVLEEAGFRGYAQVMLQRHFCGTTAILLCSALFAVGPHPPSHGFLVPKIVFYFLVAILLAVIAQVTESILPSIAVHIFGLAVFFTLVWPHDNGRSLIWTSGASFWFWAHAAQFVACSIAAGAILWRLGSENSAEANIHDATPSAYR